MKFMIPGTTEGMLKDSFWIEKLKDPKTLIMAHEKIDQFNIGTFGKVDSICELSEYKAQLSRTELLALIENYKLPQKTRYDIKGEVVNNRVYEKILKNTNIDNIKDTNGVRFGITVKSTRVRSFPTNEGNFESDDDIEFDLFQETECLAIEPVVVLHESYDGKWLFIQMYNYNGWVLGEDIALAKNRKEVFDFINGEEFLMVCGNVVQTQFNHYDARLSRKCFSMGTKIPIMKSKELEIGKQAALNNYAVKLPLRDEAGGLEFKSALISSMEDVSLGYLSYTRENILKQAFKLQGDRYDWGNKNNGRDCSSYVMYIYKTFGIILPRNGDQQEMSEGASYKFDACETISDREEVFNKAKPGAVIFMNGHVMLYIGKNNNEHYMIHDFHRYGVDENGTIMPIDVNEIAVTSTLLLSSKGKKFIEVFTSLLQLEG